MLLLVASQPSFTPARRRGTQSEVRVETTVVGGVTDILTDMTDPVTGPGHCRPRRDSRGATESLMVQVTFGTGWPDKQKYEAVKSRFNLLDCRHKPDFTMQIILRSRPS